ncbi:hypothetical protein BDR26DRAFT_869185 [Obelidium mucronatum]|nr:hypothetical protein BDR26DRAFT_869185 [Obelidium mucronatum]
MDYRRRRLAGLVILLCIKALLEIEEFREELMREESMREESLEELEDVEEDEESEIIQSPDQPALHRIQDSSRTIMKTGNHQNPFETPRKQIAVRHYCVATPTKPKKRTTK